MSELGDGFANVFAFDFGDGIQVAIHGGVKLPVARLAHGVQVGFDGFEGGDAAAGVAAEVVQDGPDGQGVGGFLGRQGGGLVAAREFPDLGFGVFLGFGVGLERFEAPLSGGGNRDTIEVVARRLSVNDGLRVTVLDLDREPHLAARTGWILCGICAVNRKSLIFLSNSGAHGRT